MNGNSTFLKNRKARVAIVLVGVAVAAAALVWRLGRDRWPAAKAEVAGWFHPAAVQTAPSPAPAAPERKILYYEDPMHPSYRSDKPGIAPDCGMQLVPVYAPETGAAPPPAAAPDHGPVQISTTQEHLIGLTTARAQYRTLEKTIRAVGTVALDETRTGQVHTRVSGWIQKVFVDYTTQQVKKGDPLFTIYSPDLVATEGEYLLALRGKRDLGSSPIREVATGVDTLLDAARQRLALWDVSPEEIAEIERSGQAKRDLTLYSPMSGRVTERKAFPNQYVTPDMSLYTLVDYTHVWVYADIYEPEIELVKTGQEADFTTDAYPGRVFHGQISYVWPQLDMQTRTLKVRTDFANPELALKPDMFGNVEMRIPLGRRLVVPESAVLDTGTRQLVFVQKGPGLLEPRTVKTGVHVDGNEEVLEGLKAGEVVASSATFLIDSESQLRAALAGMTLSTGVTGIGGQAAPSAPPAARLQITFRTEPEPPRVGKDSVAVSVRDAAGRPLDNAQVKVIFFMPAMPSMGMAAMRSEAALSFAGSGQYRGEVQVPTAGTWQVTVTVEQAGRMLETGQFSVTAP